jgi:adenylate cyclase
LRAAIGCQEAATRASRILTQHLQEQLRVGVGVHCGNAVIGRIGKTSDQTSPSRLTAIGGTVNIAARLEAATKELKAGIVVSSATMNTAGISDPALYGERSEIAVHNISEPVDVVAIRETEALATVLGVEPQRANAGTTQRTISALATRVQPFSKKTGSQ